MDIDNLYISNEHARRGGKTGKLIRCRLQNLTADENHKCNKH